MNNAHVMIVKCIKFEYKYKIMCVHYFCKITCGVYVTIYFRVDILDRVPRISIKAARLKASRLENLNENLCVCPYKRRVVKKINIQGVANIILEPAGAWQMTCYFLSKPNSPTRTCGFLHCFC